jgi:hypothetical protein
MSITFTLPELQWLQSNLQGWNEEKWTAMGVNEHGWLQNFLTQVRSCLMNPNQSITLTSDQNNFIKKWLVDYKNNSGEWIFQGPYGNAIGEGSQFPSLTGSANSNFNGQGAFGENSYLYGANIFNDILHRLGDQVYGPDINIDPAEGERKGGC